MRPLARRPRLHVLQVVREVHLVQLVVHELADVPREVVVAARKKKEENVRGVSHRFGTVVAWQ